MRIEGFAGIWVVGVAAVCSAICSVRAVPSVTVDDIDPMIGAISGGGQGGHGLGKTFPGATTPFGMVQLSPDTITGRNEGAGYSWHHNTIEGFSFFHLSGVGANGEFGNFLVMPANGPRVFDRVSARSPFSHSNETAKAGYYSVELDRYRVKAELTAAPHSGIIRFTFPKDNASRIQINLARRMGQLNPLLKKSRQTVKQVGNRVIEGSITCDPTEGGWQYGRGGVTYTVWFYAVCSTPFSVSGVWDGETIFEGRQEAEGSNLGFFGEFPTHEGEKVALKVGFSYSSLEGAKKNLANEIPGWDFDGVRDAAKKRWSDALSVVQVKGGTERERRIFATALYHCQIDPRNYSDLGEPVKRTIFSGWDVFRSEFPLLTLIRPDVVSETIRSMVEVTKSGKRDTLPVWDIFGCPSSCMIGNPLLPVMADAWAQGIRDWGLEEAWPYAVETSRKRGNKPCGWTPGSLSQTLEYAFTDWCMGRLATALGKREEAKTYFARAQWYTNCWDTSVGWMRSRADESGAWRPDFNRKSHSKQGTEQSNPYQQAWFVPHDVPGLIRLMGGDKAFGDTLKHFFEKTPKNFLWNDYYNHPNEPCHHVAFLFPYCGKPWHTQRWAREICAGAYGDEVRGLCGNDDVGQLSAWYVLTAVGFHPVAPGSGVWILTSPIFSEATLKIGVRGGKPATTFTVKAANATPENLYIQKASLNGKPLDRAWLTSDEILAGGTLAVELGPEPNRTLFTRRPPDVGMRNEE